MVKFLLKLSLYFRDTLFTVILLCIFWSFSLFWPDLTRLCSKFVAMEFGGVSCWMWFYVHRLRLLQEIVFCLTKYRCSVNQLFITKMIVNWSVSSVLFWINCTQFCLFFSALVCDVHSVLFSYWGKWLKCLWNYPCTFEILYFIRSNFFRSFIVMFYVILFLECLWPLKHGSRCASSLPLGFVVKDVLNSTVFNTSYSEWWTTCG